MVPPSDFAGTNGNEQEGAKAKRIGGLRLARVKKIQRNRDETNHETQICSPSSVTGYPTRATRSPAPGGSQPMPRCCRGRQLELYLYRDHLHAERTSPCRIRRALSPGRGWEHHGKPDAKCRRPVRC